MSVDPEVHAVVKQLNEEIMHLQEALAAAHLSMLLGMSDDTLFKYLKSFSIDKQVKEALWIQREQIKHLQEKIKPGDESQSSDTTDGSPAFLADFIERYRRELGEVACEKCPVHQAALRKLERELDDNNEKNVKTIESLHNQIGEILREESKMFGNIESLQGILEQKNSVLQELELSSQKKETEICRLKNELGVVKHQLQDAQKKLNDTQSSTGDTEKRLSKLGNLVMDREKYIEELQGNIGQLNETIERLKKTVEEKQRQITELELDVKNGKQQAEELQGRLEGRDKEIAEQIEQIERISKQSDMKIQEFHRQLAEKQEELKDLEGECTKLHSAIEEGREGFEKQLADKDAALLGREGEFEEERRRLMATIEEGTTRCAEQESEIKKLGDKIREMTAEFESREEEKVIATLKAEIEEQEETIKMMTESALSLQEKVEEAQRECQQVKEQLDVLQTEKSSLVREIEVSKEATKEFESRLEMIEELKQENTALEEEIVGHKETFVRLEQEKQSLDHARKRVEDQRKALWNELQDTQTSLKQVKASIADKQQECTRLQQKLRDARSRHEEEIEKLVEQYKIDQKKNQDDYNDLVKSYAELSEQLKLSKKDRERLELKVKAYASAARISPAKPLHSTPVTVIFTGFRDGTEYPLQLKKELTKKIRQLHGEVRTDSKLTTAVTHCVVPPLTHTAKSLGATLTGKWIVTPDWVVESSRANRLLSEERFGLRFKPQPFTAKVFAHSPLFLERDQEEARNRLMISTNLITLCGGGTLATKTSPVVDYTLIEDDEDPETVPGIAMTWSEFLSFIVDKENVIQPRTSINNHERKAGDATPGPVPIFTTTPTTTPTKPLRRTPTTPSAGSSNATTQATTSTPTRSSWIESLGTTPPSSTSSSSFKRRHHHQYHHPQPQQQQQQHQQQQQQQQQPPSSLGKRAPTGGPPPPSKKHRSTTVMH